MRENQVPLILALAAMLLSIHPSPTDTQCSPTMSTVPMPPAYGNRTLCVKSFNTTATLCNAVKVCHDNNMEIVSRRPVYLTLRDNGMLSTGGKLYWIGLTDALNERNRSKDGWVWMKDGQVTGLHDAVFASSEPDNGYFEDCTGGTYNDLFDIICSAELHFYCYTNADHSPVLSNRDSNSVSFIKAPIVTFTQPDSGCATSLTAISNRLHCSVSCLKSGADCVGFYWNSGRLECILLMYFDASVQLKFDNSIEMTMWEKFIRKI